MGIPSHYGFKGDRPGFSNTPTPFVGDANVYTPGTRRSSSNIEKVQGRTVMALQSLGSNSAPATTTPFTGRGGRSRSPNDRRFCLYRLQACQVAMHGMERCT